MYLFNLKNGQVLKRPDQIKMLLFQIIFIVRLWGGRFRVPYLDGIQVHNQLA